eukprot:jgi/Hompol1/6320/HPOL_001079-RA
MTLFYLHPAKPAAAALRTLLSPACRAMSKVAMLTSERFPNIQRTPTFKALEAADIDRFKQIVGDGGVIEAPDALAPFNQDWMARFRGQSRLVLRPRTAQQVSDILRHCNSESIAVVPQGGNTGLVGGSVPVHDEVILSTQRLSKIRSFDSVSGILSCDAGCILEVLDDWLAQRGYMMPLDLGAKGSCHIGGNVATNAGGLRLLRYGSLHGTVLSLEVVLADGTIMELGKPLRKDNTGYDLKQMFIGSEGTLGIITGVSILTPARPSAVNVAILGLESYSQVLQLFQTARKHLGEILSAFEFFDAASMNLVTKHMPSLRKPFSDAVPFYVLIETSGSKKEHDDEKLEAFLEQAMSDGTVVDGSVAQDATQIASFWSIRESIPEACAKEGATNFKYDLSVPVSNLYDIVTRMRERLSAAGLFGADTQTQAKDQVTAVVGFGHMGDGNLHLNIMASAWSREIESAIEPYVYQLVSESQGSISAEHGLGLAKSKYISYSKSVEAIELMRRTKAMLDPKGILNPYKFLPQ